MKNTCYANHRISALDPLADASHSDDIGRGNRRRPSKHCVAVSWCLYGTLVLAERDRGTQQLIVGCSRQACRHPNEGGHYGEIAKSTGGFFLLDTRALARSGASTSSISARGTVRACDGCRNPGVVEKTRTMDATRPRSPPTPARDCGRMMDIRK